MVVVVKVLLVVIVLLVVVVLLVIFVIMMGVELLICLAVVDVFLNKVDEPCRVTSMLVTSLRCW